MLSSKTPNAKTQRSSETRTRPLPLLRADEFVPPPKPDFHMPAMPPLELIARIEHWVRLHVRRRRFRRRFLALLIHDAHQLEDMNLCREEILRAASLPLEIDALQALKYWRRRRRHLAIGRGKGNRD